MMANRVKDGTNEVPETKKIPASRVRTKTENARKSVSQAYSIARDKASSAYDAALEKTSTAYETARTRASQGQARASTVLEDNPVAVLVRGIALGALVGALLPRSRRETQLLSGVGESISETTRRVAEAARESARETIDSYGLGAESALEKVGSLFEGATKAASSIGSAARTAMQKQR